MEECSLSPSLFLVALGNGYSCPPPISLFFYKGKQDQGGSVTRGQMAEEARWSPSPVRGATVLH